MRGTAYLSCSILALKLTVLFSKKKETRNLERIRNMLNSNRTGICHKYKVASQKKQNNENQEIYKAEYDSVPVSSHLG